MPRIEKKKQKMLDAAYVHLEAAEEAFLGPGIVPNTMDLELIRTRVAIAAALVELARETSV